MKYLLLLCSLVSLNSYTFESECKLSSFVQKRIKKRKKWILAEIPFNESQVQKLSDKGYKLLPSSEADFIVKEGTYCAHYGFVYYNGEREFRGCKIYQKYFSINYDEVEIWKTKKASQKPEQFVEAEENKRIKLKIEKIMALRSIAKTKSEVDQYNKVIKKLKKEIDPSLDKTIPAQTIIDDLVDRLPLCAEIL